MFVQVLNTAVFGRPWRNEERIYHSPSGLSNSALCALTIHETPLGVDYSPEPHARCCANGSGRERGSGVYFQLMSVSRHRKIRTVESTRLAE
jgi:hypothetical protein